MLMRRSQNMALMFFVIQTTDTSHGFPQERIIVKQLFCNFLLTRSILYILYCQEWIRNDKLWTDQSAVERLQWSVFISTIFFLEQLQREKSKKLKVLQQSSNYCGIIKFRVAFFFRAYDAYDIFAGTFVLL